MYHFASVIVKLALVISVVGPTGLGQEPSGKVVFGDDFARNSLESYHTMGDVKWSTRAIRLVGKSAISKTVVTGSKLDLSVEVEEVIPTAPAAENNFQVTFSFKDSAAGIFVSTSHARASDTKLRIFGPFYDNQQVLRSFDLTNGIGGKWNVRLNYGVFEITRNDQLVAVGYADVGYKSPKAITIGTTAGSVIIHAFTMTTLSTPIAPDVEAKREAILDSENHDLLYRQGHVREALDAALKELAAMQQLYPKDSPEIGALLQNIGVYRSHLSDTRQARRDIESALQIAEGTFGEQHPDTAANLSALGNLLAQQGDFEAAIPYYRRVLAITDGLLGPDDPRTGMAYSYLGGVLGDLGRWREATPYLQKHLDIYRTMFPEGDRHLGPSLIQLGDALSYSGRSREGQSLVEEALKIYKSQLDPKDIEIARTENVLGYILARQHEYSQALEHLQAALALCREVLGNDHRNTAIVLSNIAQSLALLGKKREAHVYLEEAFNIKVKNGENLIDSLPDAEALAYINTVKGYRDGLLSLDWRLDRVSTSELYDHVVKSRGMLDYYLYGRVLFGDKPDPKLTAQLNSMRSLIAALLYYDPKSEVEGRRVDLLPQFMHEKERIQRELRNKSRTAPSVLDQSSLLPRLGKLTVDTAIVEVVEIERRFRSSGDGLPADRSVYVAFVVRSTANNGVSIERVVLGPAGDIDGAITDWRDSLRKRSASVEEINQSGNVLRRLAWDPLTPLLSGVQRIIVIPDGAFARIPWEALPADDSGNAFLIDSYAISTASSSREALSFLDLDAPTGSTLLTVGGLDYGPKPVRKASASEGQSQKRFNMHTWEPLQATASEVDAIVALRGNATTVSLSGKSATKISIQDHIGGTRFVHLATHGFFADASVRSALQLDSAPPDSADVFAEFDAPSRVLGRDPLLLSGIVLSNANVTDRIVTTAEGFEVENGLLTAEEVLGLSLHNTELVILSACESGLGEVAGGEGVFGLQRAFALAGARTVIASLWKVDSKVTSMLMQQFYRNLWLQHMPKLDALRAAQLYIMKHYDEESGQLETTEVGRASPYYWASFVSYGDWR